jgi:hypothetical protein
MIWRCPRPRLGKDLAWLPALALGDEADLRGSKVRFGEPSRVRATSCMGATQCASSLILPDPSIYPILLSTRSFYLPDPSMSAVGKGKIPAERTSWARNRSDWPKADVLLPSIKDWLPDFRFGRLDRL